LEKELGDYASVCGDAAVCALFECQTYYERMFLAQGIKITYLAFTLDHDGGFVSPGEAFDADYWRGVEGPRRSFGHMQAPLEGCHSPRDISRRKSFSLML